LIPADSSDRGLGCHSRHAGTAGPLAFQAARPETIANRLQSDHRICHFLALSLKEKSCQCDLHHGCLFTLSCIKLCASARFSGYYSSAFPRRSARSGSSRRSSLRPASPRRACHSSRVGFAHPTRPRRQGDVVSLFSKAPGAPKDSSALYPNPYNGNFEELAPTIAFLRSVSPSAVPSP
jgi:hypothetical protein